jgi:ubiquinone/menaquinone biosynthesis C-methylase UbiE
MGWYTTHVVPRLVSLTLGSPAVSALRRRVTEGLHGDVLEVGFGAGLNLPHLPTAVRRVLAVDPDLVGRRLGAQRLAASRVPVDFVGLDGQALALPDASADAALVTFSLCTIPDAARALGEVLRVLRPGGRLHLLEHGLAPDAEVQRWQRRLEPLQRRLAGGCHLTRPVDALVEGAGFRFERLERFYASQLGPRPFVALSLGVAARAADAPA